MKVYYAHSVGTYGTHQEDRDLNTLDALGLEVVNPNQPHIQVLVDAMKEKYKEELKTDPDKKYQLIFTDIFYPMVEECEVFAFRALADGKIPSGVYAELVHAKKHKKVIIELPSAVSRRILNIEQTQEFLREIGNR